MGEPRMWCHFCGKSKEQVRKFIAGPSVYICDECVALCVQILAEDRADLPSVEDYVVQYLTPSLVASGLSLRSLDEWRADEAERKTLPLVAPEKRTSVRPEDRDQ